MKTFSKLLIPLGLGVLAFILNWMAVRPQLGHEFVIVSAAVNLDEPLKESNLTKFKVVGEDFDRLKQTLVPWEERAAVIGLPIRRPLIKGDFVFWQDVRYHSVDFSLAPDEVPLHISLEGVDYEPSLLKVGNQVGIIVPIATPAPSEATSDEQALVNALNTKFEELGPFRILSVGQRTLEVPGETDTSRRGDIRLVTLAVKADPPSDADTASGSRPVSEAARKLLAAKSVRRSDGKNFAAMVLYQDADKLLPGKKSEDDAQ